MDLLLDYFDTRNLEVLLETSTGLDFTMGWILWIQ